MLAVMAITLSASAKPGKQVPQFVKNAFTEKFSQATNVKWDEEKKGEWEAEFKLNGKTYSANYSTKGEWLETEYAVAVTEIPAEVKSAIAKNFPGYQIKESEISETATTKVYEFELVKGITKKEVALDSSGKIIKK